MIYKLLLKYSQVPHFDRILFRLNLMNDMMDDDSYKASTEVSSLSSLGSGGGAQGRMPDPRGAGSSSHDQMIPRPLQYSVEALLAKNDPRIGMYSPASDSSFMVWYPFVELWEKWGFADDVKTPGTLLAQERCLFEELCHRRRRSRHRTRFTMIQLDELEKVRTTFSG